MCLSVSDIYILYHKYQILQYCIINVFENPFSGCERRKVSTMAKKKRGRIAIPYLITIFVGFIIVGGAAKYIYDYFGLGNEKELSEPIPRSVTEVTYEDSHTILFILDLPDETCSTTFVLMRSVPKEKKILFVGIPSNSIAVVDGKQASLASSYARGGASSAVSFSEQILGVDIDRYMVFDSESFLKVCDIMGGVTYTVDVDIVGFQKTDKDQYLNGEQIQTFITYSMFDGGEEQRAYITSSLLASMVNQADGQRISDGLDRSFNTLINMVDTNITAVDYRNRKAAIKLMFERGTSIARFRIMTGTSSEGNFIPDKSFGENMKKEYFTDSEETT